MDVLAKMTSKGQITLPKAVREAIGLETGDAVLFRVEDGYAVLAKIPSFLDVAGTVPVPPHLRGVPWKDVREEAWRKQTARHIPRKR